MLKKIAIKKIIISTLGLIILLLISLFPNPKEKEFTNIKENNNLKKIPIYVLDNENYVARTDIIIDKNVDTIPYLIEVLTKKTIYNNLLESTFSGVIPQNTKLINYSIDDNNLLKLNFSKEFLNTNEKDFEKMLESLIFTLCEEENIKNIMIFVENNLLTQIPGTNINLPNTFNKKYGINKIYDLNNFQKTSKTTIYYLKNNNGNSYYIPITKITNNEKEPVEIIIKELTQKNIYESNLISYLTASYELKDYEILENSIKVSFNNKILTNLDNNDIVEKIKYTLSLSLRDTYDINDITININ